MSTTTNANYELNNIETIVDFCHTWISNVTGRTAKELADDASKWYHVDKNGKGRSWMWSLGDDKHPELRFQVWLTTRGKKERVWEQIDAYIGVSFMDSIDLAPFEPYRKHTKNDNRESTFVKIPMYVVKEFFEINELVYTPTENAKKQVVKGA